MSGGPYLILEDGTPAPAGYYTVVEHRVSHHPENTVLPTMNIYVVRPVGAPEPVVAAHYIDYEGDVWLETSPGRFHIEWTRLVGYLGSTRYGAGLTLDHLIEWSEGKKS